MDNLEKQRSPKRDRVLGDEWKGYDGNLNEPQMINEGKGTFLLVLLFVILLLNAFTVISFYLISPRLQQISPLFDTGVMILAAVFCVLTVLWYISVLLMLFSGKNLLFFDPFNHGILNFIIDKTLKLGAKLGISKDRMGNSFVKVFNELVIRSKSKEPLKPLIILPRCLTKENREEIGKLSQSYGLDHFVVGGGQAALQKIRKLKPQAVIGVACERDLLAGIKEVSSIPVLAIANRRPNGPCKDTDIDMREMERSIKHFLKLS